jgi:hypothetical protein
MIQSGEIHNLICSIDSIGNLGAIESGDINMIPSAQSIQSAAVTPVSGEINTIQSA